MRAALIALILVLVAAAPAAAQDPRLEAAREESGSLPTPVAQLETPAGRLGLERAELLAARHDQPIRFVLTVERAVERGTLSIAIPRAWRDVPSSGLRPSTPPRGRRVRPVEHAVEIVLDGAAPGDEITAEVRDRGIPAGTYELPVSLDGRRVGRLEVVLFAPVREAHERPWAGVRALNFSDSPYHQSETFITAVPGNPDRLIAGANGGASGFGAWISGDGGESWVERPMPSVAPRISGATTLAPCCDPTSAADAQGNLWYGALDYIPDSHIVVARVPAGTTEFAKTVALPSRTPTAQQDKPMMTIDNSPSSPTFGRLYVVWSEPSGGAHRIVASFCDSRPTPATCDDVNGWSPVTPITNTGSRTYADVAVGADGKVFVSWWNYSAANRIEGSVCATNCGAAASWSAPTAIAALDASGGKPVPNDCPIVAQPGGRAAPAPNVEVSRTDGRVYVAWSDLRAGSGTTRCAPEATPLATHLRFDPFVKSAAGTLPALATPAAPLLTDAEGAAAADDWFPWLAVDQTTGLAYAGFYSTRDDASRRSTHFYARSVGADGALGGLVRVSDAPSDYSGNVCCEFGNDYGDYAGLDAGGGLVSAAWSDKSTVSGEGLAEQLALPAPGAAPALQPGAAEVADPTPGGDGDGVPEPGETLDVTIPVANAGAATATAATGTLSSTSARASFPQATADYGDVAAGATAQAPPYRVALDDELGCGATVPLRLRVAHAGGLAAERYAVRTGGEIVTVHSADVPRNIPAGAPVRVASAIAMPAAGTIGDVDVGVSIEHTYVGELTLTLRHPDGTEVLLTRRAGDPTNSGDHFLGTLFDDEAAGALFAATAPFAGRWRPEDPLSALDGKPWAGTWTLFVDDAQAQDGGRITAWSLQRRTCGEPVPAAPQDAVANPDVDPPPSSTSGPAVVDPAGPAVDPPAGLEPPRPFVRLTRPAARLRARRGRVRVGLRGCRACRGRLELTVRANRRRVRIARTRYSLGPRGATTVTVRLSLAGRALLRRRKRLAVVVALSVTATDGRSARDAGRLTLLR